MQAYLFMFMFTPPLVSALIAVYSAETDVNVREFPEDFIQRISYWLPVFAMLWNSAKYFNEYIC